MIHPMEAPVFGHEKPSNAGRPKLVTQRRHSWGSGEGEDGEIIKGTSYRAHQNRMSAELGLVLWEGMFQAMSDRIMPTKTVQDVVDAVTDATAKNLSLTADTMDNVNRKSLPPNWAPLKLSEAHLTDESAHLICACLDNTVPVDESIALLLRRDETYDTVLSFDRIVDITFDRIEISVEPEDSSITLDDNSRSTPVKFPVFLTEPLENNSWWACLVDYGTKKVIIRLHVAQMAGIGKWRMKVITGGINNGQISTTVAFPRLHIAMNPDQIGGTKTVHPIARKATDLFDSTKKM